MGINRYVPPNEPALYQHDGRTDTASQPYKIGQSDRLKGQVYRYDKFFLPGEQDAYNKGYAKEQEDLDEVMLYYTKPRPKA